MREEDLHALIGDIYDASLEDEVPMELLARLARATRSTVAMPDIFEPPGRLKETPIYGGDPADRRIANEYAHLNLNIQRAHLFRPGRAIRGEEVASFDEWRGNPILNELWIPAGTIHMLHLTGLHGPDQHAGISLWRGFDGGPYDDAELAEGHVLARHLRRALEFGRRFGAAMGRAGLLEEAMAAMTTACLLIDARGRILRANARAEQILASGEPLRVAGGRLEAVHEPNVGRWRTVLGRLAATDTPATGTAALLEGPGAPILIHAVPLRAAAAEQWGVQRDAVSLGLVLMQSQDGAPVSASRTLMALFGLTPAEAELALALQSGETLPRYADRHGRSLNTVKTHMKAVFAKTETHRQADLIRLLSSLGSFNIGS